MLSSQAEDRRKLVSVRSRIGQSLIRLQRNLEQTRHEEDQVESMFNTWQEKWSNRRDQIARRLELIETQLESLAGDADDSPRLAVVGVPPDADEMTSMGPF